MKEVFIVGGARTPMTEYVGALRDLSALELGAIAARAAMSKSGVEPGWIDHVVFGNVMQTSADAIYGALVPQHGLAMTTRRRMYETGTTSLQFAATASTIRARRCGGSTNCSPPTASGETPPLSIVQRAYSHWPRRVSCR